MCEIPNYRDNVSIQQKKNAKFEIGILIIICHPKMVIGVKKT